jgi:kynurenine formamidase
MGRTKPGSYQRAWSPPSYDVDERGKIVGATPPEPNNWGRWGEDDERGATNLITSDVVVSAAGLIQTGRRISLAIPIEAEGPVHFSRPKAMRLHTLSGSDYIVGSPSNVWNEGLQWTDDVIIMALQGSTQWDGLAHLLRDDAMYNGWWAGEVTAAAGAARNGIQHQVETLVGRGVLLDVCGYRAKGPLAGGEVISPEELDTVAASEGVEVRSGDMVLIRTGYLGLWYAVREDRPKAEAWFETEPGLSHRCVDWMAGRDVAAVAVDNWAVDVVPFEADAPRVWPVHQGALPGLGITLGEFWWLDDLATACTAAGRHEFFLAAQPLNVVNASGTPLNPIAIL